MPATRPRLTPGRVAGPLGGVLVSCRPASLLRWPVLLFGWVGYLLLQADAPALGTSTGQALESLAGAAMASAAMVAATALLLAAFAGRLPSGRDPGSHLVRYGVALRHRARRLRTPRQLDPDAAGRPRPRAPSVPLSAW